MDASFIISISSVCGIIGTMFSGVISDKLFGGRRNVPALIFGLTYFERVFNQYTQTSPSRYRKQYWLKNDF